MIDFYNAFISYKHAPLDSKVAEYVQKNLERFVVPEKIAKKTGRKRIERIFRDKDELPITSDLTDTISNALEKSEYLIVICSPNTKKSIWVQREIEFFLKTHSKSNILTVLAEGEPGEVIPEILLTREKTFVDEDGNERTVNENVEPLSCDFRMPFKQARKEELPRLAAPLLGCSYDELMNRSRQYRMRRLGLLFGLISSVAIAFGAYFATSQIKIKDNLMEARRNRAMYLANESEKMFKDEQRVKAIFLALEALPKVSGDPLIPQVVRALTDATLSYRAPSGNDIESCWIYGMPNNIMSFKLSEGSSRVGVLDSSNMIRVWDAEDHDVLFSKTFDENVYGYFFVGEDDLVVLTVLEVVSYDLDSGDENWSYDAERPIKETSIGMAGNDLIFAVTNQIIKMDAENGDIIKSLDINTSLPSEDVVYYRYYPSPEGTRVAIETLYGFDSFCITIMDMETGEVINTPLMGDSYKDVGWSGEDRLLVSYVLTKESYNMSGGDISLIDNTDLTICCYDASDASEIWTSDSSYTDICIESGFLDLPETGTVLYYAGNIGIMYDINDGTKKNNYNLNDSIVHSSDRDDNGWPIFITEQGDFASPVPSYGDNALLFYEEFSDELARVVVGAGVYAMKEDSREIIYYDVGIYDDNYVYTEDIVVANHNKCYMDENVIAIINDNGVESISIDLVDPYENELIGTAVPEEDIYLSSTNILGTYDGTLYIACSDLNGISLLEVDIENATCKFEPFMDYDSYDACYYCSMNGDGIITCLSTKNNGDTSVTVYDLEGDSAESYDYPHETASPVGAPVLEGDLIFVFDENGSFIVDTKEDEIIFPDIPDGKEACTLSAYDPESGYFALSGTGYICLYNGEFELVEEIDVSYAPVLGIDFLTIDESEGSMLLAVLGTGYLQRYDGATGEFLGRTEITHDYADSKVTECEYDPEWNAVYITTDSVTDVFDVDYFYEIATIPRGIGHHAGTDRFYVLSLVDLSCQYLGYFEHYTLEEIEERAAEMLDGYEMAAEERSLYGI